MNRASSASDCLAGDDPFVGLTVAWDDAIDVESFRGDAAPGRSQALLPRPARRPLFLARAVRALAAKRSGALLRRVVRSPTVARSDSRAFDGAGDNTSWTRDTGIWGAPLMRRPQG
jgi:hypothetical protein